MVGREEEQKGGGDCECVAKDEGIQIYAPLPPSFHTSWVDDDKETCGGYVWIRGAGCRKRERWGKKERKEDRAGVKIKRKILRPRATPLAQQMAQKWGGKKKKKKKKVGMKASRVGFVRLCRLSSSLPSLLHYTVDRRRQALSLSPARGE